MRLCAVLAMLLPLLAAADSSIPRFTDPARRAKLEKAFPRIEKIFEQYSRERGTPGIVFGIVIDGEPALVKCYGVRDRASNDPVTPVTPDTVFRIASMTKSFTALAILQLRDAGKLSLDDPVSKWIPEFARLHYPTTDSAPIRIRELLTHSAGFAEDNPWGDRQLAIPDSQMTRWLGQGLPFSTPPDTAYEYSNYGFALLGRIVARVSGRPYREYVEKRILAPLGLEDSTLEPSAVPPARRATGYDRDGELYTEIPALAHGSFGPMGGMLTSARDLAKYVAFHLSAWPPRDDEDPGPVRRASVREMQRLWRAGNFSATRLDDGRLRASSGGYGYGLSVSRDCRFAHIVGHGGGLPGFGSYMMWLPEYGVGMLAMANLTYAGPAQPLRDAFDALYETGALQPRVLPPSPALLATRDALVRLWDQWDAREAGSLVADNFYLDQPAEARRKQIEGLKQRLGACRPAPAMAAENRLRGTFRMECERGWVTVYFTLAPTMPPRLQYLELFPAARPEPRLASAGEALAALTGVAASSEARVRELTAETLDRGALLRSLERVRADHGSCRVARTMASDGATEARVALECDRGAVELRYRIDSGGKVVSASLGRAPGDACAP